MKTIRYKYLIIMLLCSTLTAMGQSKKLSKTYKTNADVSLEIDASHTNIIIEIWDRNEVQIEAQLENGESGKEDAQRMLDNWKLETSGSAGKVRITSGGGGRMVMPEMAMANLNEQMAQLPEIIDPVMDMVGPLLESMSRNPLPPQFYESMGNLNFDYEAYQKDGDQYMKRWEEKIEQKFGKDFEASMEEWASNFEKDTVLWKKDMEIRMEKWGEDFGKNMEAWGEEFGKEMEKWAEEIERKVEEEYGQGGGESRIIVLSDRSAKAKKTIRVKMPKNGKVKMDVRHGEVKLDGRSTNLTADLSHSKFSANTVAGKQTHIRASYTPVSVKQWEYGELQMAYVKNCDIQSARSLKITSNSSDVRIGEILETGIISGSFGELRVEKLAPQFKTLDISLDNSDLVLNLPDTALNFSYNGSQSKIAYPSSIKGTPVKNYDNEILNGYHRAQNGNATVSIKAEFSDVVVK